MLIRYAPLQWRKMSTGPRQWGVHADICSGCCWRSHPRPDSIHAAARRMLWIWPWQHALTPRPEEGQETVGSSVDWSGAWDFPTRPRILLIQPGLWLERVSAPLHTRGREKGGGLCRQVEENFSEGIHCPLTERTAQIICAGRCSQTHMHEFVELAGFLSARRTGFHDACRSSCYSGCFTESINLSCQHHQPLWWKLFHSLIRELWCCITYGGQGNILGGSVIM